MVLVFDGDVLFTTCSILIPREFIFYKPTSTYSNNLFKEGFECGRIKTQEKERSLELGVIFIIFEYTCTCTYMCL